MSQVHAGGGGGSHHVQLHGGAGDAGHLPDRQRRVEREGGGAWGAASVGLVHTPSCHGHHHACAHAAVHLAACVVRLRLPPTSYPPPTPISVSFFDVCLLQVKRFLKQCVMNHDRVVQVNVQGTLCCGAPLHARTHATSARTPSVLHQPTGRRGPCVVVHPSTHTHTHTTSARTPSVLHQPTGRSGDNPPSSPSLTQPHPAFAWRVSAWWPSCSTG
jgi:hypothetical protein